MSATSYFRARVDDPIEAARQHGFLPPRYFVHRLAADSADAWEKIPPFPVLANLRGARILPDRAAIRLARFGDALLLRAVQAAAPTALRPELPPDSPEFWRQEHIEFRFLPDPLDPERQVQFIIAPDGRCWDNQGLWPNALAHGVACEGKVAAAGWAITLRIPLNRTGKTAADGWSFHAGSVRGIVAHTRWHNDAPDIACSSATELGFPHAARFGEFVLVDTPPPRLTLRSVTTAGLTLHWRGQTPVRTTLRVSLEQAGAGAHAATSPPASAITRRLTPGENRVRVQPWLDPFEFNRIRLTANLPDGEETELGAVTLRAPLPAPVIPRGHLRHPYLRFTAAELAGIRAKADMPPFSRYLAGATPAESDLTGADLPAADAPVSLDITPDCMNWFRVAKETMVRDGEGGARPAAVRLWRLQSAEAQAAWHGVVRAVTPTPELLGVLIPALNQLLHRRDLYEPAAFAQIGVPEEARQLLARGLDSLPEAELVRFNRILLQSTIECMSNYRMELASRPGHCFEQWLASGDRRLITTATRAVEAALRLTILSHEIHLHEGGAAAGLALAYDAFHPFLTRAARRSWQELLARFLRLHLRTCHRRSWTVTTIANANPVGNSGCGLVALALWREEPALARESLSYAREFIWSWLDFCNGIDGGNTEGAQYWQYGTENFVRFALALERVTGAGDGLLAHPAVRNGMNMIRVGLCNDGALHGVNDTVPTPIGGNLAWFAAGRFDDAFALWYGDHARRWFERRRAAGKAAPYGASNSDALLYRPAQPECVTQPPLPTAICVESIQYATIRSGSNFDCRWVAGLKGSRPPYTHHNQPDTGSFFLDLRGERLLIDPGYYKDKPEHHSLPLLDGRGPVTPSTWTGRIVACEERGNCRYLACDATPAYGGIASRVVRHLVLVGEEAVVLLDDLLTTARITAQYQCGGATEEQATGNAWLIRGDRAVLRAAILEPAGAVPQLQPERPLKDTHWGYHFADCRWFPVKLDCAAVAEAPLITVFQDATDGVPAPAELRHEPGRLMVRLPSGFEVVFRQEAQGWRWATT